MAKTPYLFNETLLYHLDSIFLVALGMHRAVHGTVRSFSHLGLKLEVSNVLEGPLEVSPGRERLLLGSQWKLILL